MFLLNITRLAEVWTAEHKTHLEPRSVAVLVNVGTKLVIEECGRVCNVVGAESHFTGTRLVIDGEGYIVAGTVEEWSQRITIALGDYHRTTRKGE